MKVGIMSMQRVVNYGSFLQAYSLKHNLEALGAEVCFVDYDVEKPIVKAENKSVVSKLNLGKIVDKLLPPYQLPKSTMDEFWRQMGKYDKIYNEVMLPMLGISEEKVYRPELDMLVIGSDEVFNCLQTTEMVGYSKELFGYNNNSKRLISYAASFGNTNEEGLKKYKIYDEVKEMINKFDALSARDANTYSLLDKMYENKVIKNVDPVFLYDFEKETEIEVPISDYIVVYAYSCRIGKAEAREIKRFAKKYNKKIVCLCNPQRYLDGYLPLNPFEVLAYVKKADYVVTDTFHGTVFSIKNNKKFATFLRSGHETVYGNNEKLYDLLDTFNLLDRSVNKLSDLENILLSEPDYNKVNTIIDSEVKKGKAYLKEQIDSLG